MLLAGEWFVSSGSASTGPAALAAEGEGRVSSDSGRAGNGVSERETISDRLLHRLRQAIVSGELEEGSLHSIYALAEQFGVSRTPVRDAVLRLADAGMVTVERNRGVRVRGIDVHDVRRIFQMRLLLEVPAARLAASRGGEESRLALERDLRLMAQAAERGDSAAYVDGDVALHDRILGVLDNDRIAAQVRALRESTLLMDASTFGRSRTLADVHAEHMPIVAAIAARDVEGAGRAMRRHLVQTATLLARQIAGDVPWAWPEAELDVLLP